MKNVLKLSLFALLVLSLAVPVGANAQEPQTKTYDPVVVNYIESVIYEKATSTVKTSGNNTMTIDTRSVKMSDDTYLVVQDTDVDGSKQQTQSFTVTVNSDGTYRLVNEYFGIDELFTDKKPDRVKRGSSTSTLSDATITLRDRERGTPNTLVLSDSYSSCSGMNNAKFDAPVKKGNIDVSWQVSGTYKYYCLVPLFLEYVEVQHGTDKQRKTYSSPSLIGNTKGYDYFTHSSYGNDWDSISVKVQYG